MTSTEPPSIRLLMSRAMVDNELAWLHLALPDDRAVPTMPSVVRQPANDAGGFVSIPTVCLGCRHEWVAVTQVGYDTACLECPECGAAKGMTKQFVHFQNGPKWHCLACNNFLFSCVVLNDCPSMVCATCGNVGRLLDLFDAVSSPS